MLPPRGQRKDPQIEWVIIEEPEMGLHPQALNAVMALVLDLLWLGYKVRHQMSRVWTSTAALHDLLDGPSADEIRGSLQRATIVAASRPTLVR